MWDNFLETLKINPEHGDWVAALMTMFIFMVQCVYFLIKNFNENKQKRIIEEKELYQDMKKVYNDLWLSLTSYSNRVLYCNYQDRETMKKIVEGDVEKVRTYVYQVIDNLADVYFMYYSRESRYWKRWESIIEYVFSKQLFRSSWETLKPAFIKRDPDFVIYVTEVIKKCEPHKETEE